MGIPDRVKNSPELFNQSVFYYLCFQALTSCRAFEGGRIPWTAVVDYANERNCDSEQRQILFEVVEQVDLWLLKFLQDRSDKKNKALGDGKASNKIGTTQRPTVKRPRR